MLWNRLHEWPRASVGERLHRLLLGELCGSGRIDFSR
jgi:hypothetical protein